METIIKSWMSATADRMMVNNSEKIRRHIGSDMCDGCNLPLEDWGSRMPTYEYKCSSCGRLVDLMHKMHEKPSVMCPSCVNTEMSRMPSAGNGIHFRGSGFYETDYKGK